MEVEIYKSNLEKSHISFVSQKSDFYDTQVTVLVCSENIKFNYNHFSFCHIASCVFAKNINEIFEFKVMFIFPYKSVSV